MSDKMKYCSITAVIAMCILLLVYVNSGAIGNTFLISDAYDQYSPLLSRLSNILSGDASILYSFNGGIGFSFLGTFFYYLSSPFNLILLLIKDVNNFLIITTLLKLVFASVTAYLFFDYNFKKENKIYTIIFALSYIFISFNMRYFFNIMWLDAVYLLPLLLLGIDKFIDCKKKALLIISLVMFIFTNYYMGYMACIFAFIYFNYKTIIIHNFKNIIKENLKFILIILLCLLLVAFTLIPVIIYLPEYARAASLSNPNPVFNLNILDFFSYFLMGNAEEAGLLNSDSFYLYMGLITLPLIIFYFINKEITRKEKILTAIVILTLFVSTAFNFANYMWHGFSAPQFFNGRFTFFFSLFLLMISYKSLVKIANIKLLFYILSGAVLFAIIYFAGTKYIINNVMFIFIYLICLYFINSKKLYVPIILLAFVISELTISAVLDISTLPFATNAESKTDYDKHRPAVDYIENIDNSEFYRIETNSSKPFNSPINYDYNGIDMFLSTVDNNTANFFIDIGYGSGSTKRNTLSYYSGYEIIDSFLGVKYHISHNNIINENYIPIHQYNVGENTIYIYQNPYALSLGYMVSDKIQSVSKTDNALEYQNNIFNAMISQNKDIFTPIELLSDEYGYNFVNNEMKDIFIYTKQDLELPYDKFDIYINSQLGNKIHDLDIVKFDNDFSLMQELYLSYSYLNEEAFEDSYAAYFNKDNFISIIEELKRNELNIDIFKDSYIKGTVTATEEKNTLLLTIPHDKNWTVYVNGKKTNYIKILDVLIGIDLGTGTHTIELRYQPKEFYLGLTVSLITLLLIILFKLKRRFS